MSDYLLRKGEFPDNFVRVRRSVVTCLLCASVKVTPILDRLKFASKFFSIKTIGVRKKKAIFRSGPLLFKYQNFQMPISADLK